MTRFLIYISQAYSIPIGRPLQSEIQSRGLEVMWFCDEEKTQVYLTQKEELLKNVQEVKDYNPDVVLVATNVVPDFFSGIKVQVFHGFSVGKRSEVKGHFNIRGFFDLYCTQGPSSTKTFEVLQNKYKYFQVIETGWSKVDPLFPLEVVENTKPTVMISSTFTTKLSLAKHEAVVSEIQRISELGKWKFIAVLHPKMEREIVEKFKSMQHEYFTFHDTTNLVPLFKQADVMLADTTSAITEFVLQKKPVVTINNNIPASYMINIHTAKEIEKALEIALSKPVDIMQAIENFVEETHPYMDGMSSKRVIDACLNFLKVTKMKRKPFNFIRRFKIRKKLNYYGLW